MRNLLRNFLTNALYESEPLAPMRWVMWALIVMVVLLCAAMVFVPWVFDLPLVSSWELR